MLGWFRQHKVLKQRECILNIITQPTDTSLTVGYDEAKIMISLFIPDGKPLTDSLQPLELQIHPSWYRDG